MLGPGRQVVCVSLKFYIGCQCCPTFRFVELRDYNNTLTQIMNALNGVTVLSAENIYVDKSTLGTSAATGTIIVQ